MKNGIRTFVENINSVIACNMRNIHTTSGYDTLMMVLAAYNDYQESERDGVDYIFDINDKDDVICCMSGGMTTEEVAKLWQGSQVNHSQYFFFGCNYETPKPIENLETLKRHLVGWLDEVMFDVLAYPYAYESYKALYGKYITENILLTI